MDFSKRPRNKLELTFIKTQLFPAFVLLVPVEQLRRGLVDEPRLAVVIPGGHTPEAGVSLEQGQRGREVLEEVGGDLQVVLDNDHLEETIVLYVLNLCSSQGSYLVIAHGHQSLIQRPAVMAGNLEIALELLLLLRQPWLTQVWLLDVDYLVSVALDDIPESKCQEHAS